ncbi:MAG: hypothetical protein ACRDWB_00075, partial [Acidimicrobiales bacterium]
MLLAEPVITWTQAIGEQSSPGEADSCGPGLGNRPYFSSVLGKNRGTPDSYLIGARVQLLRIPPRIE